jgi:myo-inositol-1(or 4)-monophosphatase
MENEHVLRVATAAAMAGLDVHRAHLGRVSSDAWAEKGANDFVTHVDREAESRIIERIRSEFPNHQILAEEQATAGPPGATDGGGMRISASRGWLWIIDPLDGTTNYLHRYPMYAVSIAALHDGVAEVGVVVHGATGETWTAVRGRGAWLDGQRIRVSAINRLAHALVGTGFPFKALALMPEYLRQFDRVIRRCAGIRRAGSAALDLCHVASAYFDGFWELSLAPWDIAAGALMVREAGGVVTRIDGDDDVHAAGSVLAGNARVHAALASLLAEDDSTGDTEDAE